MQGFKFLRGFKEAGILLSLIVLCIVVWAINSVFIAWDNILNILRTTSYVVLIATTTTMVMIIGGLDLSIGSMMGLGGILASTFMVNGIPVILAILLAMMLSSLIGLFNGFIIVKRKVPPLITTLGTMYIARGICNVITKGMPVYPLPTEFAPLGNGTLFSIPYSVFIALALALFINYVLKHTIYGRSVYAIGGNQDTARLSGIAVDKIKISTYVFNSITATFAGIVMTSRIESGQVSMGNGWELTVIASVVIGGTSTLGGSGTILGTIIGVLMMSVVGNGMVLMKVSVYWQNIAVGAIIILAVFIDVWRKEKSGIRV